MQSATERSGKREKKAPLQRQSFEREQHGKRDAGQGTIQAPSNGELTASSQATARKQKHAGTEKLRKGPTGDRAVQEEAAAGQAQAGDGAAKVQKKQKHAADQGQPGGGKVNKKQKHAAEQAEQTAESPAAPDGEQEAHHKKRKRPDQESRGIREQTAEERAQSRLASFAKPTLAGPGSASQIKKKKKKQQEQQQQQQEAGRGAAPPEEPSGPKLTKAQKKNLWRAKRRAMQHKQPAAVPAYAL